MRLSGRNAASIAAELLALKAPLRSWGASLACLLDDAGNMVDEAVATFFAAPRSYTAEDVVEISCHGSPVVLRHCVDRAVRLGARPAEPGEFTLRAFLNGRIDLPQAEGVRDLIDSTTLYQARIAAQQSAGSVSHRLAPVKAQLLELVALLEAGIDFAEDDISVAPSSEILRRIEPILATVDELIESFRYGKLVRSGFSLAIVGQPNAGKSSLFNCLLSQERAIVTEIPGTTRDLVSETVEFAGIPVRLVDTAGIRETSDQIEKIGVERARQAMADADLAIVLVDVSKGKSKADEALIDLARRQGPSLIVLNKCDLLQFKAEAGEIAISALTGEGIPELKHAVLQRLAPGGFMEQDGGFLTSVRQETLLRECSAKLREAQFGAKNNIPHEFLLVSLGSSLASLGMLAGKTTADDLLSHIFTTFCIGK